MPSGTSCLVKLTICIIFISFNQWVCLILFCFGLVFCCFFIFEHLYWSIIALQWCVTFCCITKCIRYTYTYIPISPPSYISLLPSLSHTFSWTQSTNLTYLCYAIASHQLSILHLVVYICPCHSLTSSQLTLPPPSVLKSILQQVCETENFYF